MKTIWFIWTWVMWASMYSHIMQKIDCKEVYVYNRTKSKAEGLMNSGAIWGESIENIAKKCDIIFTIIGYPKDVEEIYLWEKWLIKNAKKWTILVEMTTSTPELAKRIYENSQKYEISSLDAPVTWWDMWAKTWNLSIMVWWDESIYNEVLTYFEAMWKSVAYMWKAWNGQHTKLANQIAIATNMAWTVEMLLYAKNAWLDSRKALDLIWGGSASSWQMVNMWKRILEGDFEPWFFIKHFVKDMWIVLDEAKKMNLDLPTLNLINSFYVSAMEKGLENKWTQALYEVLETL